MRKIKTKFVSVLCIVLTLFTFITECYVSTSNKKVYANSNDNRALDLAIAEGKNRTEISELATNGDGNGVIDNNSMRNIALYLSNFYQPFVTTLTDGSDIGVSNKTADDKAAKEKNEKISQFSTDAINALTKYVGVDEEVAQILVKNTLKQSLDTCQHLYMTRASAEKLLNVNANKGGSTFNARQSNGGKWYIGYGGLSRTWLEIKKNYIFDNKSGNDYIVGNYDTTLFWRLDKNVSVSNCVEDYVKDHDVSDYIKALNPVTVGGKEYVEMNYFLYLTAISYTANHSSSVYGFYWNDTDTGSMIKCFDSGGTCTQAFLWATNEIDTKNGIGTSMCSLPMDTFDKYVDMISGDKPITKDAIDIDTLKKTLIFFNNMYVNWVGDIVINDGKETFVMIPGCLNPYSLVTMSEGRTDFLNGVSVKALTYKSNNLLESANGKTAKGIAGTANKEMQEADRTSAETGASLIDKLLDEAIDSSIGKKVSNDNADDFVAYFQSAFNFRKGSGRTASNCPIMYNITDDKMMPFMDIYGKDPDASTGKYDVVTKSDKILSQLTKTYQNNSYTTIVIDNKAYVCFYNGRGLYKYLVTCGYNMGKEDDWETFDSDMKTWLADKDNKKAKKKVLSSSKKVLGPLFSKTAAKTTKVKFAINNVDGASDRYDIATKAKLNTIDDGYFTVPFDATNMDYENGNDMFTFNKYRLSYGDTSKNHADFDADGIFKQRANAIYRVMGDYGLGANNFNAGNNYVTFPSLMWSTFACSLPDGASDWAKDINAAFRKVSGNNSSTYMFMRLGGTKDRAYENLPGYKMHDKVIYFPDYSVDISDLNSAVETANIFDTDDKLKASSVSDMSQYTSVSNGYGQVLKLSDTEKSLYRNIFMTYAFAEFNYETGDTTFDENTHKVDLKFNGDIFPDGTGNMNFTYVKDTTGEEIESFVYYLLHPTKGVAYVATWFRNKVTGILLYIHESIVGSSNSNYTTGMTKYLGTSSYTTMPKLSDVKLLSNILSIYNNTLIYLVIIMLVVILCFVVVGDLTIQRGLIGIACFAMLATIIPPMINGAANLSNLVSDQIFSGKFEYWAISQLETYMDVINTSESDDVITDNSLELATQISLASASTSVGGQSNTGYSGTMLKWMSPKKYASSLATRALQTTSASTSNASYLKSFVQQTANNDGNGQDFNTNSDNALYLYRDYVDIYRYGANSYNLDAYGNAFLSQDLSKLIRSYTDNTATQSEQQHGVYNVWHAKEQGNPKNVPLSVLKNIRYSSSLAVSDIITMNYDYGIDKSTVGTTKVESTDASMSFSGKQEKTFKANLDGVRSTFALNHGFLYNTFGDSLNTDKGVNYFSFNNTRASTLLLTYAATIAQTQDALNTLSKDIDTGKVNLTYKNFIQNKKYCYGIPHDSYDMDLTTFNNLDDHYTEATDKETKKSDATDGDTHSDTTEVVKDENLVMSDYKNLSDFYYDLYTESPFFYFNYNIRDQLVNDSDTSYTFNNSDRTASKGNVKTLWLGHNQDYFYNYSTGAGDGYGELRDFMNFHDFFYYVIPSLQPGIDLLYKWDKAYGYYLYDDCSLKFTNSGTIKYDGKETQVGADNSLGSIISEDDWNALTEDERYKLWHNYNVMLINESYCSWLDTMEDCNYSKPETISIMGEKYKVMNPLDPTSYFTVATTDGNGHKKGDVLSGRYMIFSRSEMKYYGLKWTDLTKVEKKIITVQDKVYKEALNLMNYTAVSDENLIQAYSMLETFIFNKEFSQKGTLTNSGYIMYPQGYELKAFTYDAYLRLILAESSDNIDLEVEGTNTNNDDNAEVKSIYQRIMENTSIFFGILLIFNDLLATYAIPAVKILILVVLFLLSIMMLIASVVKLELNILNNFIKNLLTPLLIFTGACISLSFIVSLFMSNGADYITEGKTTVSLGDPTMTVITMIVINALFLSILVKILIQSAKNLKYYAKAVTVATIGAVTGAFKTVGSLASGSGSKTVESASKRHKSSLNVEDARGGGVSSNKQKHGIRPVVGGALGAFLATKAKDNKEVTNNSEHTTNWYDSKAKSFGSPAETKAEKDTTNNNKNNSSKSTKVDRRNTRTSYNSKNKHLRSESVMNKKSNMKHISSSSVRNNLTKGLTNQYNTIRRGSIKTVNRNKNITTNNDYSRNNTYNRLKVNKPKNVTMSDTVINKRNSGTGAGIGSTTNRAKGNRRIKPVTNNSQQQLSQRLAKA